MMFSKSNPETPKPYVPPYRSGSLTEKGRSVLHAGVTITGNWTCDGIAEFGGTILGDLTADTVVLSKTSHVTGTIRAGQIIIEVTVVGAIHATTLSLRTGSDVSAKVFCQTLSVDLGAKLDGTVQMIPQSTNE